LFLLLRLAGALMLPFKVKSRRSLVVVGVLFFVGVIALQLTLMARANSCTWDEADHTYAGYMQWKHGDFGLNSEHPPLLKFLAAAPLLDMPLKMPVLQDRLYRLQEVNGGRDFLFQNDANTMLFRVRMAASVLTLLLAVLVFLAAREMFGTGAGFVALGLICFDPTLLGHSALVTTDAGQACFMLWAIYAFYRYMKTPTVWRLVTVGLVVGLALATKHSAVLLFPMLLLLGGMEFVWWRKFSVGLSTGRSDVSSGEVVSSGGYVSRLVVAFFVMCAISITVLWSSYGFRFAARGEGLHLNPTMAGQLHRVPSPFEAEVLAAFARGHLLPESYIYGFGHVLFESRAFHSFLLGTVYPHPVWFYFPIAMLIKSTLTFLILLGVGVWAVATGRFRCWREILYLVVPAGVYMAFAMAGGMNIGVRHVLPVYVFLSVAIAGAAWKLIQRNRRWLYAVVVLLVFQAVSVLHAFPAYVSYANEAFGGPANVHRYLSDSSADWGQQMKSVKRYLDERGIKNCWFAYFGEGVAEYSYYGIPCKPLITADSLYFDEPHDVPAAIDGPVLISAGALSGFEFGPGALNAYGQFKELKPTADIDFGVFVYEGHFDIPLASALSHVQKAGLLLRAKDVAGGLLEAQQAESLAPESARVNMMMGQALDANGRRDEARPYYEKALRLAKTVEPKFQVSYVAGLEERLGAR
jgi:hypothetical protein